VRAIQITEFGGPEVLTLTELPEPTAPEHHDLIDVTAAGVNYADTHQAEDSYLAPQQLPLVPGAEVVGRRRSDGKRVVALLADGGGYAEVAAAPAPTTFDLPDNVSDDAALALVLQGTTAWHLLRTSAHLSLGESVVVHSGAGGVGSLAVQLAKQWGAGRVIATASNAEKRQLALDLGADVAIDLSETTEASDVTEQLREANGGRRVDIVLEMTGGHVLDGSVDALAPFGRLVAYGMASRTAPKPVPVGSLMSTSRSLIGFWLMHAVRRPGGLAPAMEELVSLTAAGVLHPVIGGHYALADAAAAHTAILSRGTTGKLVLDVSS
jgi:NADPH2:quinone reductase